MQFQWLDIISLIAAIVFGGIIGIERKVHDKPAGFRTNILICLGSCLFTIISTNLAGSDTGRIAAQVVTGIGFIGAGAIIQSGPNIHGLTTAAGIWTVAAIGMACGARMYVIGFAATILTLIVLLVMPIFEKKSRHHLH